MDGVTTHNILSTLPVFHLPKSIARRQTRDFRNFSDATTPYCNTVARLARMHPFGKLSRTRRLDDTTLPASIKDRVRPNVHTSSLWYDVSES